MAKAKGGSTRLGDEVACDCDAHGGPCCPHQVKGRLVTGAASVLIDGKPAARSGDVGVAGACCGTNAFKVGEGARTVLIEGARAARQGDLTVHCGGAPGEFKSGSRTVLVEAGGKK